MESRALASMLNDGDEINRDMEKITRMAHNPSSQSYESMSKEYNNLLSIHTNP